MQLNPYLHFDGDCATAFKFYAGVFGARDLTMMTHRGSPAEAQTPPEWQDKIMHARMTIGGQMLMGSDSPPGHFRKPQGFTVSVGIDDPVEGERIFNALAEAGVIGMPFQQTFWAAGFGMVTDQFGVPWMVNCEARKS
jgi:PhnB protein